MKIYYVVKSSYYVIIAGIIIGLGVAIYFLYNNFYCTLAQTQVVYILKSQVAFDSVDIKLWNKVLQNFEDKKTSRLDEESQVTDPFISFVELEEK